MYVPLRVHGWHSLLTGVDAPQALLERAGALGCEAMALTDVDSMGGLVDLFQASRAAAASGSPLPRPIAGAELSNPHGPGRVVALVRDAEGYRNLCRLISARHLGADPGDPSSSLEGSRAFDLAEAAIRHQAGLTYLVDHPRLVLRLAGRVAPEALFVAVAPASLGKRSTRGSDSPGAVRNAHLDPRPKERRAPIPRSEAESELEAPKIPPPSAAVPAADLIEVARATRLATVAVPDVYYAHPSSWESHRLRVAIKHNALLDDLPGAWLAERPAHLASGREVERLYAPLPDVRGPFARETASLPGCLARTERIAASCRFELELGGVLFPEIELEGEESAYSRLASLAFGGARERYRPLRPEVVRRLDYELAAIDELGFAPYFLLVLKLADFARARAIPCVGRGSAADSLVSYCLGLTDADPLRYRLPFERFLNPARQDRPDIDLDFCWRRRDEVIEHVYEAFGPERTAMIATLNTFGLRSAFRETALVHGIPPHEVHRWSGRLPYGFENRTSGEVPDDVSGEELEAEQLPDGASLVAEALARTPECRDFPQDDPRWRRAVELSDGLVGSPRHLGLHPGGVVVSPGAITAVVACQRATKGVVMTQLDKNGVEALGLVKMDLLGNRALTVITDCLEALEEHGQAPDLAHLAEDDPATAQVLRTGRTLGCFQVESPGMRHLLQQTGASTMDDVIQAVALIRPGPAGAGMKDAYVRRFRGREEPTPPHPLLGELLWDTHGVMLYQEDVMQAATLLAGMDLAEADLLRRTLQKRHARELEPLARRFREGCAEEGVSNEEARSVWELIANFASFAFCKAHAVTYGRIAYRTVYLKTHHPAAFLTAFLNSHTGYYQTRVYVEEARRLGVAILPPDINQSATDFRLEWEEGEPRGSLRIGLERVRGLTQSTLERILEEREQRPFLSLPDFLERTGARTDEVENLIRCGAFDTFDRTRPELLLRLQLLRSPRRGSPRHLDAPLDASQLAACKATPGSKRAEARQAAAHRARGWSGPSLGLGGLELAPGESTSLFPEPETPALALPSLPESDARTRGLAELELLGLTVELHPVELFPPAPGSARLLASKPVACAALARHVGKRVSVRGWLAATRRARTARGEWMRFLTLEDESGLAEGVLFPAAYRREGAALKSQGPFVVTGTVEDQLGASTLHVESVRADPDP